MSENTNDENSSRGKKRSHDDDVKSLRIPDDWVSASKTRNSALDDKCLDYFDMYNITDITSIPMKRQRVGSYDAHRDVDPAKADNFTDYILRSGIQFENDVVQKMRVKFGEDFVQICQPYDAIYVDKCEKTLNEMKKGTPIIYQGVLHNPSKILKTGDEKTFGCVDLLVRCDWLNYIVRVPSMSEKDVKIQAPKLKNGYHYRIVDIKWSKLHLNVNGLTIRNNQNVKPFKTQVLIYNEALGYMQGYKPPIAYLMGNGWICERYQRRNKITQKSNDPFDKLGEVHFKDFDSSYVEKASDAVIWYRSLMTQTNMTHDPPNCEELYPNMSNSLDGKYHHIKEQIAQKYNEITQIWNCGFKERECAFSSGITNWKDKRFNAGCVGLREGKKQRVIDEIVRLNRDTNKLILPEIITNNTKRWQNSNINAFYVDFETLQEGLCKTVDDFSSASGDFIFMIGVGRYNTNGEWIYRNITANVLSLAEERRIINEFMQYISNNKNNDETVLFHWGFHEQGVFQGAIRRHNMWSMPNFVNFCQIMTDVPIVVRGSYDFGLKSVAKAMHKLGLIKTIWNTDVCDGSNAMFLSWKLYMKHENIETSQTMKNIVYYNSIDCQTMAEIINFLSKTHKNKLYNNSINITEMVKDDADNTDNNTKSGKNKRPAPEEIDTSDEDYIPKPSKKPRRLVFRTAKNQEDKESKEPKEVEKKDTTKNASKDKETDKEESDSEKSDSEVSVSSMSTSSSSSESSDEKLPPDVLTPKQRKMIRELVHPNSNRIARAEDDEEYSCHSDDNTEDDEEEEEEDGHKQDFDTSPLERVIIKLFAEKETKYPNSEKITKLKKMLMDRMVKFDNIYNIPNITDDDKTNLMEKYIQCITNGDVESFIRERNELSRMIENYKKSNLQERIHYDVIKKRLEESTDTTLSIEKKILDLDIIDKYKKIIYNKYKQLVSMSYGSDSHAKLKEWIEHTIKIPYNILHTPTISDKPVIDQLEHVKKTLDENLFGMKEAKESLLMVLNNKLRNPDSFKNTLAFVGPPGTGKTALILALCKALGMPFHQISLGGKHDSSFFIGHSYTYEGSKPGQLVTALQQMGCKNGILFFDEFDKLDEREGKSNVSNLLLHVTDFTQNNNFYDEYVADIPIDLSRLWFIFSLNDMHKVDPILRNRITPIYVPGYSDIEKEQIIRDYILPKLDKQFGFNKRDIIIESSIIHHIIKKTPKEEGVREVERSMGLLYQKLNLLRTIHNGTASQTLGIDFDISEFKLPLTLTEKQVSMLLEGNKKEKDDSFSLLYM